MPGGLEELNNLLNDDVEKDDLTPVLLAHLRNHNPSHTPLTRRRYNALQFPPLNSTRLPSSYSPSPSDSALTTAIVTRRGREPISSNSTDKWDDSSFRTSSMCVVCCADQRCIVLWPCRCLALCDGCRGELAARSTGSGGSSLCPCCRAVVQGYSRIMIP